MGEEVRMTDFDERVTDWESGLPAAHDLTPLYQTLIPPELASAFSISPLSHRTLLDVTRASRTTLSALRGGANNNNLNLFPNGDEEVEVEEEEEEEEEIDLNGSASDSRKLRKIVDCAAEEADSAPRTDSSAAVKRPRLVWTPQLHKRFVDVVAHLGIKNAVPKTIMQLMNVEGLTRENVASHLQKYRLYLKRMQGLSADGPSSSDHLFASTPVPQSLSESGGNGDGVGGGHSCGNGHHLPVPIPYPYPPPVMPSMPMLGHGGYHGYENHSHHPYNMMQQRDWSANNYASAVSYHHVAPNDR